MAGAGSKILASDYNNIWNLVNTILGVGTGQYGYNQTLNSSQVAVGKSFKLIDWTNLRTDLVRIGVHQSGSTPSTSVLPVPGNLSPITVSSATQPTLVNGLYQVTFSIPIQAVAPSVGASYRITGSANQAYNGTFISVSSTVTSVTLGYVSNPGAGDFSRPILIASVLTYDLMSKYLTYANSLYVNAYNPTITNVTGTISSGQTVLTCYTATILMLGGRITGPGLSNATITSVVQGQSLTVNQSASQSSSSGTYVVTLTTGVKTVDSSQVGTQTLTTVTRNTSWNGDIQTTATFTFRDSNSNATTDAARAFFNAGGQIEISPILSGTFSAGSNIKDQTWQTMFQQVGKIIFRANDTTQDNRSTGGSQYDSSSSNPSVVSTTGWFELTTVPTLIFIKNAPSGAYSANAMNVYANRDSTGTQLLITVRFQDDAGGNIDENVDGSLQVVFSATYATGANVSTLVPLASTTPIQ